MILSLCFCSYHLLMTMTLLLSICEFYRSVVTIDTTKVCRVHTMTATLPTRRCTWRIFPTKLYPRISAKCSPSMDPWVTSIFPWITTPSGPEDSLTFRCAGTEWVKWFCLTAVRSAVRSMWEHCYPNLHFPVRGSKGRWGCCGELWRETHFWLHFGSAVCQRWQEKSRANEE